MKLTKKITLFIFIYLVSLNIINAQWKPGNDDIQPFINITYANKDIAWGLTNIGDIYKSKNTQNFIPITHFSPSPTSLTVIDTNTIMITKGNQLWKTDDAGNNWETIKIINNLGDSASSVRQVYFFNSSQGFIMGNSSNGCLEIWTTSDGGNLWEKVPCKQININLTNIPHNFLVFRENGKIIISQSGPQAINNTLIIGTDFGKKWNEIVLPKNLDLYQIAFKDSLNGVATRGIYSFPFQYHENNIAITKDGGNTWDTSYKTQNRKAIFAITYAKSTDSDKPFYISGARRPHGDDTSDNFGSDVSFDDGKSWHVLENIIEHRLFSFYDNKHGMTTSLKSTETPYPVYFFKGIPNGIVGVKDDFNSVKKLNAYPNPFKENFTLDVPENAELNIYDIQGKQLKNVALAKGKNTIDVHDLVTGTYFIVIKNDKEIFHSTILKQE